MPYFCPDNVPRRRVVVGLPGVADLDPNPTPCHSAGGRRVAHGCRLWALVVWLAWWLVEVAGVLVAAVRRSGPENGPDPCRPSRVPYVISSCSDVSFWLATGGLCKESHLISHVHFFWQLGVVIWPVFTDHGGDVDLTVVDSGVADVAQDEADLDFF